MEEAASELLSAADPNVLIVDLWPSLLEKRSRRAGAPIDEEWREIPEARNTLLASVCANELSRERKCCSFSESRLCV